MSESRTDALAVLAEVASWDRVEAAGATDHSWPEDGNLGVYGEGGAAVT